MCTVGRVLWAKKPASKNFSGRFWVAPACSNPMQTTDPPPNPKHNQANHLNDVPNILRSMAELATRHARAQTIIANTNRIILIHIRERVLPLRHRAHKHADTLLRPQIGYVIAYAHDLGVEGEGDFAAVGGQVVRDGVLNDA